MKAKQWMGLVFHACPCFIPAQQSNGHLPLLFYKHESKFHWAKKLTRRVVILMSQATNDDNEQRYALLSRLFGRRIASTYDLTVGEAKAILKMAYHGDTLDPDPHFLAYLEEIKESL